jgi:hypothetical protein
MCNRVTTHGLVVRFISNKDQNADILTKALAFAWFQVLRYKLNVHSLPLSLRGRIGVNQNLKIQTTTNSLQQSK